MKAIYIDIAIITLIIGKHVVWPRYALLATAEEGREQANDQHMALTTAPAFHDINNIYFLIRMAREASSAFHS